MNQQSKLLASVGGVAIASAVVVGAVFGAVNRDDPPAKQQPAAELVISNTVETSPAADPVPDPSPVSASPETSTAVPVSPSKQNVVQPDPATLNEESPVTDPTTQTPAPPVEQPTDPADTSSGGGGKPAPGMPGATIDEGGVTRAPAPPPPPQHPSEGPVAEPGGDQDQAQGD